MKQKKKKEIYLIFKIYNNYLNEDKINLVNKAQCHTRDTTVLKSDAAVTQNEAYGKYIGRVDS